METQATRRCEWFPRRRMKTSSRANAPVCWSVLLRKKLLTVWWWDGDIKMSSSKKEKRVLNHQKWGLHAKNTQYLLSLRLKSSAWMITTFFIADSTFGCRQSVRTNQQRPLCSPHATLDGVPRRRHICLCCVARSYWALAVGVYMDATASGYGGGRQPRPICQWNGAASAQAESRRRAPFVDGAGLPLVMRSKNTCQWYRGRWRDAET